MDVLQSPRNQKELPRMESVPIEPLAPVAVDPMLVCPHGHRELEISLAKASRIKVEGPLRQIFAKTSRAGGRPSKFGLLGHGKAQKSRPSVMKPRYNAQR